jgi:hypothetical protein
VIEAFRQLRPDAKELELVHRLDRDTSGLLMIAKKRSMLRHCTPPCAAMVSTSATWRWCVATGRLDQAGPRAAGRATCAPASAWSR